MRSESPKTISPAKPCIIMNLDNIQIIKSSRASHIRISIDQDKNVNLILPRRVKEEEGIRFLRSRRDWVEKTLKKIQPRKKYLWEFNFSEDETIFFFGLPHRLQFFHAFTYPYILHNNQQTTINKQHNETKKNKYRLQISGMSSGRMPTDYRLIISPPRKKLFMNFLSNKLREHIYGFAYQFCKTNGFAFKELKIKNIRSRWGSCSRAGNLNFSSRLVHYHPEVINYVVIHEFCHTREMNHSRRFWSHVASFCPEYKKLIKMLK